MAQTVGKQNGTLTKIFIDGVSFTHITESSHSISVDTIEVTSNDSGGDAEHIYGKRGATFSLSGFFADDATKGYTAIETLVFGRTTAVIRRSTEATGDHYIEYTCLVTSLEESASTEGERTYSASFLATGAQTIGVVS